MNHIDPLVELKRELGSILNPVRYLGGEYGQIVKKSADLTFALAFPDLYEIAMSNTAIKILYDGLNALQSVRCERVFVPALDFEKLLKQKQIPLYTLETGIPLNETDIIGVSLGYEPGITGLLCILDTGGIPLEVSERTENDPIVIAGGCGVTNPAPFEKFIDAFFIGEAEAGLFTLVEELAELKKKGATRGDLLRCLESNPHVWTARKDAARSPGQPCARRAVYTEFGSGTDHAVCFPVPNMRIVQDHGVIEIMRGCPNGCRFCHAGIFYRPQRMKSIARILEDAEYLVHKGGYREISLMSLSSGDYEGIDSLLDVLTKKYRHRHVSFQLPSLKVNSFTLPLLEKMAEVRKSGLTFAVETPVDAWQFSLNKEVYRDKIVDIILEAKKRGWNKAKFYFMVGLPVEKEGQSEEEEIVKFLLDIQERTHIQCNANIGTFIPKPHTPYQWARQLSMEESKRKLDYIRKSLPRGRFKVNTQLPSTSFLEAIITRGDSRVGDIILEAYRQGCRLDAWDDQARPDIWQAVVSKAGWNVEAESIRERSVDEVLPWDGVSLGVTKVFLRKEKERSERQELTSHCDIKCNESCGVCNTKTTVVKTPAVIPAEIETIDKTITDETERPAQEAVYRAIVSFSKKREASYIPHLALCEVWNKAFQRSGLPVMFTEGFNPLPRFELSQSLSLGISSDDETGSFLLYSEVSRENLLAALNEALPENIRINRVFIYPLSRLLRRESLSKYLWGNTYRWVFHDANMRDSILADERIAEYMAAHSGIIIESDSSDISACDVTVPFSADRGLRDTVSAIAGKPVLEVISINKIRSLATNGNPDGAVGSFMSIFESVAADNAKAFG